MTEDEIKATHVAMKLAGHTFSCDRLVTYRTDKYASLAEAEKAGGTMYSYSFDSRSQMHDFEEGMYMVVGLFENLPVIALVTDGTDKYALPYSEVTDMLDDGRLTCFG